MSKITDMIEEYACNPEDYDIYKMAEMIRNEAVEEHLENMRKEMATRCGY